MALARFKSAVDYVAGHVKAFGNNSGYIPAVTLVDSTGADASATAAALLTAGTSRSGTVTSGGTAQTLAAANASRRGLTGQNISAGDLWINENGGAAAVAGSDSWLVEPGATFRVSTNEAVSIIGATTGQKFTATEV